MKINKLVLMCAAFASIIIANPFATQAQSPAPASSKEALITWTATGKQSEKNVDVLFVQNAKDVSFSEGKLVLRGVNPVTVCFTDSNILTAERQTGDAAFIFARSHLVNVRRTLRVAGACEFKYLVAWSG